MDVNPAFSSGRLARYQLAMVVILLLGALPSGFAQVLDSTEQSVQKDSTQSVAAYRLATRGADPGKVPSDQVPVMDVWDLYRKLFRPNKKKDPNKKPSSITVIPNVASNPTIGSQIGIKAVAGKVLGKDTSTYLSVAATSASITTKGILYFYITHNVFTNANKLNLQGSIIASKSVTPDFGLGDGDIQNGKRKGYIFHSEYYTFKEKVYKQIVENIYWGAGLEFNIRRKTHMDNGDINETPYGVYSLKHGFDPEHYMANGFLFNFQYTSRDNQNRAYKGIYADAGVRINQSWIGSTKNATQLTLDFRKYFSLSEKNPEHVLALWTWSSYVLGGTLPYLELPGTGRDPSYRSGRGYTISYFKGDQFFYYETEYRFPITRNKLFSGVAFFNIESINDKDNHIHLFDSWQPAGGAGLRVLFNKATRTNLCLDYAWGKFGNHGFFLGLNEAF